MGIPSFYRWLVNRYPSIVSPAKESRPADGIVVYDNLYLDMNQIIHYSFHPQDQMNAGTDVCAPTTVSEVFESMFDYLDRLFRIVRPRRLLYLAVDGVAPCAKMNGMRRGRRFAWASEEEEMQKISEGVSDPNVITPGTEFMEKISQALTYYIRARLNSSDPGWKHIMVILSDANVPGEGEHKIMSFIRAQRSMEGYDPNTRHCLFGHDADLIMLALASHEVHFSILREDNSQLTEADPEKQYLFLNIWVLREYLEIELKILDPVCEPDIERLIDDFIFICFLMGNDFIPHIPSLEMKEYALDLLIEVYKTTFNKMGGYIVNIEKVKDKHAAYLEVSRLEIFFHQLSMYEEKIFLKRYELEQESLKKSCRDVLREASESERLELSRKLEDRFFNEERPYDKLRLGLPGWKSRFYREYFGIETSNEIGNLQNDMAQKYLEGLCWMLQYYLADVPSWSWYYPFYVAPFVSDLKSNCRFEISFTVDKPLRPFDQLMAVLPLRSSCALPECYRKVMGRKEFDHPKLQADTIGKRFLWKCISEEELLQATKELDKELSMHEMRRNTPRQEKIFLQRNSNAQALAKVIVQLQTSSCSPEQKLPIDSAISGLGGWLSPDGLSNGFFCSPLQNLQDITNDQAISAMFFNPEAGNPIPRLLSNVKVPDKTVTEADISRRLLWHTYPGSRPPPPIVERPDTIWKPISKPSAPREEHKNAGTGWMGRGRGNAALAAAETTTQLLTASSSSSSSYGHGAAGSRTAAETQRSSSSSSSRRGSRRADMVAPQSRNSRFDDSDGGAYGFRPLGIGSAPWTGDGSGGGHGRGRAQPRGW
ncbi:5'-3' exoribonuclease 2 isoform X7 [Oryza sativa Japonica Group]|uniref:5'-3' exoribonuclease n=2 Tax=Oryza sativa subsp. japonica TaxID=39947 RepID=A0A0P0VJ34_ORYSJ|nr:5'-3' exoribonuclease 4 isoform X9 [Oryza sativa Japonica Group]BAD22468.1 putative 5'-3' exoribonuclease [Oryza sativa Japonica Group]BAF08767.1 Os02g0481900 [Oryza sativa Japonica Group]BAS78692.1 Os02g0481900 [Oryza sativa Japonica Group]|eukprot:NP_001046853.1 Os02g0481900 [Oryza sativa Japonica Group]